MTVIIGSENSVKVAAARAAFEILWPNTQWHVAGTPTQSGIAAQPMSDAEAIRGARNRAHHALAQSDAAFGVGLEGGLQEITGTYFESGWAIVIRRDGREGIGSSLRMEVPPRMIAMIRSGMELGLVCDRVFGLKNSKQQNGYFGIATGNAITRTTGYRDAVIAALAAFVHPELFHDDAQIASRPLQKSSLRVREAISPATMH